jgi:hypothetical protein
MMIELRAVALHCLLRFCHLLLTIETRRNRSGGDWVRRQIQIEFSRRGDNPSLVGFRHSNLNSAETDPVSDLSRDEMLV